MLEQEALIEGTTSAIARNAQTLPVSSCQLCQHSNLAHIYNGQTTK
jgi:hypothetical protein